MTDRQALLNPPVEAAICRKMIALVSQRANLLERELGTTLLDRETYLQKLGAARELRAMDRTLTLTYNREFNI
jgi:hypothetical protein